VGWEKKRKETCKKKKKQKDQCPTKGQGQKGLAWEKTPKFRRDLAKPDEGKTKDATQDEPVDRTDKKFADGAGGPKPTS